MRENRNHEHGCNDGNPQRPQGNRTAHCCEWHQACPSTWTITRPRRLDPARCLKRCCPISWRSLAMRPAAIIRSDGQRKKRSRLSRERIAKLIGATAERDHLSPRGATESDNLAIKGRPPRCIARRAITSSRPSPKHKAVLDTCKHLEKAGFSRHLYAGAKGRGWLISKT